MPSFSYCSATSNNSSNGNSKILAGLHDLSVRVSADDVHVRPPVRLADTEKAPIAAEVGAGEEGDVVVGVHSHARIVSNERIHRQTAL